MPLPTLPTALDELGQAAFGSKLTSAQWNAVLRLIEALSLSEELRQFPSGWRVGDDTNFIKVNPATGRIEFGGTRRPWATASLPMHFQSTSYVGNVSQVGTIERFVDGANDYIYSKAWRVPDNWDVADDITLLIPCDPQAALVAGVNEGLYRQWRVWRRPVGAISTTGAHRVVDDTAVENLGNVAEFTNIEITKTLAGGTLAPGDYLMALFYRIASDPSDTLGTDLNATPGLFVCGRVSWIGAA